MVLLEVIIALAIFTGVAFALVMALDAATEAANDRNHLDAATTGLENEMTKISNARLAITQRNLPDDGSGITYRLEIAPALLSDDQRKDFRGFLRVTLYAHWKNEGREESRDLSQLVYQP